MNWIRIILDGLAMAAYFNLFAAAVALYNPRLLFPSYPPAIIQAAPRPPTKEEKKEMILRHARMQVELKGEYQGIREMRKHVAWYTAGCPGSSALRNDVNLVETLAELEELIESRMT